MLTINWYRIPVFFADVDFTLKFFNFEDVSILKTRPRCKHSTSAPERARRGEICYWQGVCGEACMRAGVQQACGQAFQACGQAFSHARQHAGRRVKHAGRRFRTHASMRAGVSSMRAGVFARTPACKHAGTHAGMLACGQHASISHARQHAFVKIMKCMHACFLLARKHAFVKIVTPFHTRRRARPRAGILMQLTSRSFIGGLRPVLTCRTPLTLYRVCVYMRVRMCVYMYVCAE
jgi:hypothetical protein